MKLFHSSASPFVRKVMVVAHELGLADRIERVTAAAHPINRNAAIRAENPLGQVPTFVTENGTALYDSRVICEYLDETAGGGLFGSGAARWDRLTRQALADGLMAAAVLARYESTVRPDSHRWDEWIAGQMGKITDALDRFEATMPGSESVDIGTIAVGCALGYLDFRFPSFDWRTGRPQLTAWFERFGARPSMTATQPRA